MCSYHGWQYDVTGRCIDQPLEPRDSSLKNTIRHLWYPVEEWAGVVWTYMGPEKETRRRCRRSTSWRAPTVK